MKTIHYLNGGGVAPLNHQQFIYNCARDTIQFAFLLISSKTKHRTVQTLPHVNDLSFQLPWKDALWLGRNAFFLAFWREGTHYAELCHLFSEPRTESRKDLQAVTRRAQNVFPLV